MTNEFLENISQSCTALICLAARLDRPAMVDGNSVPIVNDLSTLLQFCESHYRAGNERLLKTKGLQKQSCLALSHYGKAESKISLLKMEL